MVVRLPLIHRLTASQLSRARSCLYWARADVTLPERQAGLPAALGSAFHEGSAEDAEHDIEEALRDAVATPQSVTSEALAERWGIGVEAIAKLECLRRSWADWWPTYSDGRPFRAEVPFAFDAATGKARLLPSEGQRDYSACSPTEIPGTLDTHWVAPDRSHAVVLDLKTGFAPVPPASENAQLAHNALCVARVYGVRRVTVAIAKVRVDGVYVDEATLDSFALASFAAWLAEIVETTPDAVATPGTHCKETYCPAMGSACPAGLALAVGAASALRSSLPSRWLMAPIESPEHAEALIAGLPQIEAWIAQRKKDVRAYADDTGGFSLTDGRVYAGIRKSTTRPDINAPGAVSALRAVFGERATVAMRQETKTVATWETIKEAARATAKDRGGRSAKITSKGVIAEAKEVLDAAGAIKRGGYIEYKVRTVAEHERALDRVQDDDGDE